MIKRLFSPTICLQLKGHVCSISDSICASEPKGFIMLTFYSYLMPINSHQSETPVDPVTPAVQIKQWSRVFLAQSLFGFGAVLREWPEDLAVSIQDLLMWAIRRCFISGLRSTFATHQWAINSWGPEAGRLGRTWRGKEMYLAGLFA